MNLTLFLVNKTAGFEHHQMFVDVVSTYVLPVFCAYAILTNVVNIVVFSDRLYNQVNKFRVYLRVLSVNLILLMCMVALQPLCLRYSNSLWAKIYELYVLYYLTNVFYLSSFMLHFYITLYGYFTLSRKSSSFLSRTSPTIVVVTILMFSFVYALPGLMIRRIVEVSVDCDVSLRMYSIQVLKASSIFSTLSFVLMQGFKILILLLVSVNVTLVIRLKRYRHKRYFQQVRAHASKTNRKYDVLTCIWISFIYTSSHLIYTLTMSVDAESVYYRAYQLFNYCLCAFMFGSYFFVYMCTNFIFRKLFMKNFRLFICPCRYSNKK